MFEQLGGTASSGRITEPARLFRSLPNRDEKFPLPRDIQTEVWNAWYARRTEHDLVLKMNTGSGKTVVGLLILQSSLNEGVSPAVYLVPDLHLRKQVVDTASALGLRFATEPSDPMFRRGQSILIATVSKLFQGFSQFGVRGGRESRIPIGAVIIDDAHACIPIVEKQYAMTIPRADPAYERLLELFSDDLKGQSLAGWNEIRENSSSAVVAVPFWDWQNKIQPATQILAAQADDEDNKYKWPLMKEKLSLCDVAFAPNEIEIGLSAPYLDAIPSFVEAQRRIYMTATLADDSVVVSKLGADPATVLSPITPSSASDLGDRMILTPLETSKTVTIEQVREMIHRYSQSRNVVVIVPSKYRADAWRPFTDEIHDKNSITNCVERLENGTVGLVVFIAKYDGVDLPGNACRLLVIDGLPERYSPLERAEAAAIGDTDAMRTNQVQRIEQGMGRGIRSATDHCAVVLLDPRLVQRLDFSSDVALLSPGTRQQLKLSQELALQSLAGQPIEKFEEALDAFFARDPAWTVPAKNAIDALEYPTSSTVQRYIVNERFAFEKALQGRYQEAFNHIMNDIAGIAETEIGGWMMQRAASYINHVDPVRAKTVQRSALLNNNYLSHQQSEIVIPRISLVGQQAEMSAAHIAATINSAPELDIAIESILADLTPTPVHGSSKAFEAALHSLGLFLGFASTRPEKETRNGPDVLWAIGDENYWVIECKSEATSATISRGDLEQLTHSVDWFESKYTEPRFGRVPVMIHPSRAPHFDATPRQGSRIMTFPHLADLRQAVRGWGQSLLVDAGYRNVASIKEALVQYHLAGNMIEQKWTGSPTS